MCSWCASKHLGVPGDELPSADMCLQLHIQLLEDTRIAHGPVQQTLLSGAQAGFQGWRAAVHKCEAYPLQHAAPAVSAQLILAMPLHALRMHKRRRCSRAALWALAALFVAAIATLSKAQTCSFVEKLQITSAFSDNVFQWWELAAMNAVRQHNTGA
jgi:hypothetical protein